MDCKEPLKQLISSLTSLLTPHQPLRMHFLNIYFSSLSSLLSFFTLLQKNLKNPSYITRSSTKSLLLQIETLINNSELTIKKLENSLYFEFFGLNRENYENIVFLYRNYDEIVDLLEKNGNFEIKEVFLHKISENSFENKLIFIDEEVRKLRVLLEKPEIPLKFNKSLCFLQNDLSYIFFANCLIKLTNFPKRLLKPTEFLQFLAEFLKDFDGFQLNDAQLLIIQKKLRITDSKSWISAKKCCFFFDEIWGNINEKTRILVIKTEEKSNDFFEKEQDFTVNQLENFPENRLEKRSISFDFSRKIQIKDEKNQEESEEKEDFIEENTVFPQEKKENCFIF